LSQHDAHGPAARGLAHLAPAGHRARPARKSARPERSTPCAAFAFDCDCRGSRGETRVARASNCRHCDPTTRARTTDQVPALSEKGRGPPPGTKPPSEFHRISAVAVGGSLHDGQICRRFDAASQSWAALFRRPCKSRGTRLSWTLVEAVGRLERIDGECGCPRAGQRPAKNKRRHTRPLAANREAPPSTWRNFFSPRS